MTNKEINIKTIVDYIELNLSYYRNENTGEKEYSIKGKDLQQFATNLLSKLQVLDRDNVAYCINRLLEDLKNERPDSAIDYKKYWVDQICQLIPEQGEVIFKGKYHETFTYNLDNISILKKLKKYNGKEIIIKVVGK